MYNKYIDLDKIKEYDKNIDNDKSIPIEYKNNQVIREVCRAGLYLSEELKKINCPDDVIVKLQFHAGKLSFGRDIWEIHQTILMDYKNNSLIFEEDLNENKN